MNTQGNSPAHTGAIDQEVIEELREIMEEAFSELIDAYLRESPSLVGHIRMAIEQCNAEELRRAAHSLKSSSANLGAKTLSRLAEELETLGRSGSTEGGDRLLVQAEKEYQRVEAELIALRS
jgi:two-component system sensor histidine kinase/response regulator